MIFEEVRAGGCLSYLVGCPETCSAVLIDPELSQIDRYLALAAKAGLRFHYVVDTHTHADHFSAARELSRRLAVPTVMHRASLAPYVDVRLDDGLAVHPAHEYKGKPVSTLGQEKAENPRLQRRERAAFVAQMRELSLGMPEHLTEALRTNRTGGKTVAQLLGEAATRISF